MHSMVPQGQTCIMYLDDTGDTVDQLARNDQTCIMYLDDTGDTASRLARNDQSQGNAMACEMKVTTQVDF